MPAGVIDVLRLGVEGARTNPEKFSPIRRCFLSPKRPLSCSMRPREINRPDGSKIAPDRPMTLARQMQIRSVF